ncbi:MAG TPA: hypothetical protein PK514_08030 [Spirochaetota bacterium]|nr:hypothetical protein [Spirochaetota bacterium]
MPDRGIAQNQRVSSTKVELSRSLRKEMTGAEKVFREMALDRKMLFG